MSVLTDEEAALVAEQRRRLSVLVSHDVVLTDPTAMLALVDRLVARVDLLEKVAKAAEELEKWDLSVDMQMCTECHNIPSDAAELEGDSNALSVALDELDDFDLEVMKKETK